MSAGDRKEQLETAGLLIVFFILNIAFNAYNKGKGAGFQVPLLATMTHALAGFATAFSLSFFPDIYTRKEISLSNTKMVLTILGISVFFAASIGLNNTSLQFLALSLQQIIRSTTPAAVAVTAYFIEKKQFTTQQIISLCTLVGGVMLAVLGDVGGSQTVGIFLCFGSVFATSLQYTFVSITMSKENRLKGLDLLFYTAGPTLIVLTPALIANSEISKLLDYTDKHGWSKAIGWILIGQTLAVTYNLTIFTFIHSLSAVYLAVCGVFKVVLVITFSIIVFGDPVGVVNAIGLFIAMASFCYNSYLEYESKIEKEVTDEVKKTDGDPATPDEHKRLLAEEEEGKS